MAKRKSLDRLGQLQRAVMEIVWESGEVTVADVRARLSRTRDIAYTTVLSAMQKLEKAGWLRHQSRGRAYVYRATRARGAENLRSLRRFLRDVFRGDAVRLFQHLLESEELSAEDLDAIKRMIAKKRSIS